MARFLRGFVGVALLGAVASCTALLGDFSSGSGPGADGGKDTGGSNGDGGPDTGNPGDGGGNDATNDADAGGGGDSGDGGVAEGGGIVSCSLVKGDQRILNGDGGSPIAIESLRVFNASQTNVIGIVKTGSQGDVAYGFRSDRPGDAPNIVQFASSAGPARMLTSARSVANDTTYVLANDSSGTESLLYTWPDGTNISSNPVSGAESNGYQTAVMIDTNHGLFYGISTVSQGVYVDLEAPPALPQLTSQLLTTAFTGIGDGLPFYRLSDDSVSLVYPNPNDGAEHQVHYPAGSTTPSSDRVYYPQQMLPVSFLADGTNVDIAAVEFDPDAGTVALATAAVPESQLFTFDAATTLKPLNQTFQPTSASCLAVYPGKLVALLPQAAGMDLYILDVATGTVSYSLVGASNLLNSDTTIAACAIGPASITSSGLTFEVMWSDNVGGGLENLMFAPLQCTIQ